MEKDSQDLKICLACSMGGHFTQMLELKEVYEKYDHFFVTIPGTQTISALANKRKYFLPKRVKIGIFVKQLFISLKILLKEKPDVIITTGSGDMFWICLLEKLLRKKIVYIESFSRVTTLSKFGNIAYRFADLFIYQWEKLRELCPKGIYGGLIFDMPESVKEEEGNNEYSHFVTVGTLPNDFSRLLSKVDELVEQGIIAGKVFAQVGRSEYIPKNYDYVAFLDIHEFENKIKGNSIVITHGGVGSIMTALKFGKKVIVVPRYKRFGEIKDAHQLDISQELERQSKIVAVYDIKDMDKAVEKAKKMNSIMDMEKTSHIKKILKEWLEKL